MKEVALLFLKIGFISFGGPAAHIAMMEDEVVTKRKWISRQHFLDLIGATNLIPGPNSTEMTMHCGYERAGWTGLFVAGICFILPAIMITGAFAWFYKEYGEIPAVDAFFYGIKPAVLSIIAAAIYKLGQKALKSVALAILGVLVLSATLFGISEVYALIGAGILGASFFYLRDKSTPNNGALKWIPVLFINVVAPTVNTIPVIKIFWIFLKVGALLYGSGYVLFAYLDAELIDQGLMTQSHLMDAIAIGQFTPGPVLSTATFIGYQLGGIPGALAATVGIFLPSFLFVLILNPLVPKLCKSKFMSHFLDSVNIAAVAVMLSVLFEMGYETLTGWPTIIIAVMSFAITFYFQRINAIWIVIGGAVLGRLLLLI